MDHFAYYEFDCQCNGCMSKGEGMDSNFLRMIDMAREVAGVPFKIDSGLRCESHNKSAGGKSTSSHLTGHAADIATPDSKTRYAVLQGLHMAGFKRMGVAETFIHCDNDPKKPLSVCWVYS